MKPVTRKEVNSFLNRKGGWFGPQKFFGTCRCIFYPAVAIQEDNSIIAIFDNAFQFLFARGQLNLGNDTF